MEKMTSKEKMLIRKSHMKDKLEIFKKWMHFVTDRKSLLYL